MPSITYKALTDRLLRLYREKCLLEIDRSPHRKGMTVPRACSAEGGKAPMFTFQFHPEALWLIPAAGGIAFMLWTLWHLHKELRR